MGGVAMSSRRSSSPWPRLPRAVACVLTAAALSVAALVAAGAVLGDAGGGLMLVNVVAWWLLVAVFAVGVILLVGRHPLVALPCLLAAILLLVPYCPTRPASALVASPGTALPTTTLTVATYNVAGGEPGTPRGEARLDRLRTLQADADPDVLLVEEVDLETAVALRQGAVLPHAWVGPPNEYDQRVAVLSRWPISGTRAVRATPGARPTAVVELTTPRDPLEVLPLHLPSPCYCLRRADLAAEARDRRAATVAALDAVGAPGAAPVIVGGDLNSGPASDPARTLARPGSRTRSPQRATVPASPASMARSASGSTRSSCASWSRRRRASVRPTAATIAP